ncbi:hypothetical protein BDV32DRAFT_131530 [Aspergillus pseudonomiae]|nr:hypothetical protein BDV32DRAFT_131530 [Aspergillus pseudonomiae]
MALSYCKPKIPTDNHYTFDCHPLTPEHDPTCYHISSISHHVIFQYQYNPNNATNDRAHPRSQHQPPNPKHPALAPKTTCFNARAKYTLRMALFRICRPHH